MRAWIGRGGRREDGKKDEGEEREGGVGDEEGGEMEEREVGWQRRSGNVPVTREAPGIYEEWEETSRIYE